MDISTKRLWLYNIATLFLPESRCYRLKNAILRWAGLEIGQNVRIYSSARFIGTGEIEIGNDVHIGPQVLLYAAGGSKIKIGNCIDIAPRVSIVTGTHEIDTIGNHIAGSGLAKSVDIGDGCWLCLSSLILPGVSLAEKTIIAAGAVVTQSTTESQCLLAGVPACVKKSFDSNQTH